MSAELEGVEEFSLKQTKWSRTTKNGVTYYSYTFEMLTDKDKSYVVETVYLAEDDSFYTFNITGQTALSSTEILPFKLITTALSLAAIGFCVWMVIDCAKRNVRKKALWIILILCGFAFTVTFGYNFGINFSLMLAFVMLMSVVSFNTGIGSTKVYASVYDPTGQNPALMPIETEKEWKVVETILKADKSTSTQETNYKHLQLNIVVHWYN